MRIIGTLLLLLLLAVPGAYAQEEAASDNGFEDFEDDWEDFYDPFDEGGEVRIADPLERFNRASFWFNDRLYFHVLKPVARAYRVVPLQGRRSADNFFSNLLFPVRFINSGLQLKFAAAGNELRRFLLNSTVGVAGLFDPAAQHGWRPVNEDFGQTLGHYGAGPGFYLVIPVLGPSNLRDGLGRVADGFLDPLIYVLGTYEVVGARAYSQVNALSLDDDTYEKLIEQAIDPYLFIRNAFTERREALIRR